MIERDSRGAGSTAAGEDKGRQDIVEFSTASPQKESGLAAESSGNIGKHYRLEVGEILELRSSRVASIGAHGDQSRGIKINPRLSLRDQPESRKTLPARRRWRHNNSTNNVAASASETLSGIQELKL